MLIMKIFSTDINALIADCNQLWPTNKFDKRTDENMQYIYKITRIALSIYRWSTKIGILISYPATHYLSGKPGFIINIWQPFDMTVTPWYQIVHVVQYLLLVNMSIIGPGIDSLFAASMVYTICHFKMCGYAFRTLYTDYEETPDTEQKCWEKMKSYIQYHSHLIR